MPSKWRVPMYYGKDADKDGRWGTGVKWDTGAYILVFITALQCAGYIVHINLLILGAMINHYNRKMILVRYG